MKISWMVFFPESNTNQLHRTVKGNVDGEMLLKLVLQAQISISKTVLTTMIRDFSMIIKAFRKTNCSLVGTVISFATELLTMIMFMVRCLSVRFAVPDAT